MKKITQITEEQASKFGEWVDMWVKIGLSTESADFDTATEAALKAYRLCNLNKPQIILRMSSPYGATIGGTLAWMFLKESGRAQVRAQVGDQVWAQVRDQVWAQVRDQVWAQVRAAVYNDRGGSFWANWCAFVSFIRDVLGWQNPILERFEIDEQLTKNCGWVWWHENVLAISDRPCKLERDDRGRLHCEDGPAIAYRDGWSLYYWHGVAVSAQVIERSEEITTGMIDSEDNAEVRRVMMERYGEGRYLEDSGATLINEGTLGKLYRREFDDDEPLVMVRVINSTPEPDGSSKAYWLEVPPDMSTAHQAIAWTFGMTESEYAPSIET